MPRYSLRTLILLTIGPPLVATCIAAEQNEEKKAVHDSEVIKHLAPLIIRWAKDSTPLPGPPPIQVNRYGDTQFLRETLAKHSAKAIYIACNIKGNEGPERFSYKYDLKTRTITSLTPEDIKEVTKRWENGTLSVAEQMGLSISQNKDGSVDVSCGIGLWGGTFVTRRTINGFQVLAIKNTGNF